MKRGDTDAACELFAESVRLDPAPGAQLNLADCEERRGRLASARQDLIDALGALPAGDDRIAYARERIAGLDRRVPTLAVSLAAPPSEDTEVLRDGLRLSARSLGQPVPVDPGRHEVRVRVPGHRDSVREITVAAGERKAMSLELGDVLPAPVVPKPPPEAAPPEERRNHVLPFGLLGGGAVALVAGGVLGVLTLDRAATTKDHCLPGCDEEGYRAAREGRWMSVASPVLLGAAVALAGAGFYLLFSESKHN